MKGIILVCIYLRFGCFQNIIIDSSSTRVDSSVIHEMRVSTLTARGSTIRPSPSFIAKNQLAREGPQTIAPVIIPSLKCDQVSQNTDILLSPVRALKCYLDRTEDSRAGRQLLFVSLKLGHSRDGYTVFHYLILNKKHHSILSRQNPISPFTASNVQIPPTPSIQMFSYKTSRVMAPGRLNAYGNTSPLIKMPLTRWLLHFNVNKQLPTS